MCRSRTQVDMPSLCIQAPGNSRKHHFCISQKQSPLTWGFPGPTYSLGVAHHASRGWDHPSPNGRVKWILLFHCLQSAARAGSRLQQVRLRRFKSQLFLKWEARALFEITQMSSVMMPAWTGKSKYYCVTQHLTHFLTPAYVCKAVFLFQAFIS